MYNSYLESLFYGGLVFYHKEIDSSFTYHDTKYFEGLFTRILENSAYAVTDTLAGENSDPSNNILIRAVIRLHPILNIIGKSP